MIRIDPNATEMPEPIPWIKALTITAAVVIGRAFLRADGGDCQCIACRRDGLHDSDCAVHSAPALSRGSCDCSLAIDNLKQGN